MHAQHMPGRLRLLATVILLTLALLVAVPIAVFAQSADGSEGFYRQTNLVSDLPDIARVQDKNLVNSWGLVHGPATPWWVADNGAGESTLYVGNGTPFPPPPPDQPPAPLVASIPRPAGAAPGTLAAPTGVAFTGARVFVVSQAVKS